MDIIILPMCLEKFNGLQNKKIIIVVIVYKIIGTLCEISNIYFYLYKNILDWIKNNRYI